ncbi:MAG: acyl-ACP--UDP-N-acetylglucosamine O-acyltransferase [Bdellovibrionales bacterium]|jgi:UDP-N-acetylglucosamine acyltransferase|nr:acyl-ACP--UDP-N-acetylglucosamine O-acyltransferase [Bdellovibrionales bacterium]
MSQIHPSSVISKEAEIASDVIIGPFCIIRGRVKLGPGCVLESHVSLGSEHGIVEIGARNRFSAGAVVGGAPQDLSFKGEQTKLVIGDDNTIREMVTINVGSPKAGWGTTRVGSHCLIMAYSHIAHDCSIGDHVVIANTTQLAGHVILEDHVKVGGICAFNQFVKVGTHAYIAGDSAVNKDILPFTIAQGKYAIMRASNRIGMERAGYSKEEVEAINRAVRIITKGGGTVEASVTRIRQECAPSDVLEQFLGFAQNSSRGLAL